MKKFFLFLIAAAGLVAEHPTFSDPQSVQNTDIFLSFMRSGTNWLFTCIQALTGKPLYYVEPAPNSYKIREGINHLNVAIDHTKKPLYHTHIFHLGKQLPTSNRLLVIVRNYKEIFIRRVRDDPKLFAELIARYKQFFSYTFYLKIYDNWDPNNRLLVYYEDLIEKPEEVLKQVLDFLGEKDDKLPEFMANFETYRQRTVESYHKVQSKRGGSMSKGIDVLHHSKKVPVELLKRTDAKMKRGYSRLWKLYLQRYETKDEEEE